MRERLGDIDGVEVLDQGGRRSGIVTFRKADEVAADLAARLRRERVNVSVTETSSARLDLGSRKIDELVRASVHYFNTEEEIGRVAELIAAPRT